MEKLGKPLRTLSSNQVEKLVTLPGLRDLLATWPVLASATSSFLPQLTLRVFLALLPTLLALLGRAEGRVAESQVEFGCVRRYFIFQVRTIAPMPPMWSGGCGRSARAVVQGLTFSCVPSCVRTCVRRTVLCSIQLRARGSCHCQLTKRVGLGRVG